MRRRWGESGGIFLLLVVYLGAFATVDLLTQDDGIRLAPFSTLAPFVAGALLSLRLTAVMCGLCMTLITVEYGFVTPGISGHNQAIVIASAAAACVVSMVVCRARLARERRTEGLRITAEAAQRLLLRELPLRSGEVVVDGFYVAAEREALIGGDLYEVLATPYGTRVLIGDVRGKGLSAIGASSAVLTTFRESAYLEPDLSAVVERLEAGLNRYEESSHNGTRELFVTALALELTAFGTVRIVGCGHAPPLVIGADGEEVTEMDVDDPGLPLGLGDLLDGGRPTQQVEFPASCRVLVCTDGVSEARGANGEFYPLLDRLRSWAGLPTVQLLELLRTDLERYAGGSLSDDASALVIDRGPVCEEPRGAAVPRADPDRAKD